MTRYLLTLADGTTARSAVPGRLGGNRVSKIYGRLDCASAIRALARGYAKRRVFFADEVTAIAAGYRPCAVCMREEYQRWKRATRDVASRGRTWRHRWLEGLPSTPTAKAGAVADAVGRLKR